jgi:hypothetical protein
VYLFAVMYNDNLFRTHKLRKFFEEEQLAGPELTARYLKNFELKRKEWPFLESFLSNDVRKEAATGKEDRLEATSMTPQDEKTIERAVERGVDTALHKLTAEVFRSVYKVILVLAGVYLVYQYGLYVLGFLVAVVSTVGHALGMW